MKTALYIIGNLIKWGAFIFTTYIFWLLLIIMAPQWIFVLYIYAIIFFILNFPKRLFAFILTSFQKFKKSIDEDEALSPTEEFIYKGCIIFSIFLIGMILYTYFHNKTIEKEIALIKLRSSDIDLSMDPIQVNGIQKESFTITAGKRDFNIKPIAQYKIIGVVIAKNNFLFDATSSISPVDIGLAWGEIAKPEVYKRMKFYSNFRILTYNLPEKLQINKKTVTLNTSHNHIIPANNDIKNQVMNLRYDDIIILEGYLVEVTSKGMGHPWKSSLKRDDHLMNSGAGCEIFYVEKITKL